MRMRRPLSWHVRGIVNGLIAMTLRLTLLFAVMAAGYWIYTGLGAKWFYVFIFAMIAARLHFEILWIERNYPESTEDNNQNPPAENPFRKR
jgi:hypothetical protein